MKKEKNLEKYIDGIQTVFVIKLIKTNKSSWITWSDRARLRPTEKICFDWKIDVEWVDMNDRFVAAPLVRCMWRKK